MFYTIKLAADDNGVYKNNTEFAFTSPITVLVGPNGAGKTTVIRQAKYHAERNNNGLKVLSFDNITDGGSTSKQRSLMGGNMELLASLVCSSEGEELAMNIGIMAARIGHAVRNNADKKKILVFFDAIDSGASIDRIQEFKDLLTLIVNDAGEDNIRIIIAANSFELARGADCMNPRTGKHIRFESYEEYSQYICGMAKKIRKSDL